MSRLTFFISYTAALASACLVTDCATDKRNTLLTVHQLDLSPSPIVFPGELTATIYLTVNQRITHLFLDRVVEKQVLGQWITIPCISATNKGSCSNIDVCSLLDRISNGSFAIHHEFGLLIDALLLSALVHQAHCPIEPETVFIKNENIKLQAIPNVLGAISEGTFRITISVKDDPTNPDNLGCIQFEVSIAKAGSPQAVG